jgi:hypothetical protein
LKDTSEDSFNQMIDFDMLCVAQSIAAHMMKKRNLIFHHLWLSTQASEMGCKGSMSCMSKTFLRSIKHIEW